MSDRAFRSSPPPIACGTDGDRRHPRRRQPDPRRIVLGPRLDHDGEVQILTHFTTYETVRTSIEAASFAKHFERFAFAMTDVKERFRGLSLAGLFFEVLSSIIWILIYAAALPIAMRRSFRKQPTISQGETQ